MRVDTQQINDLLLQVIQVVVGMLVAHQIIGRRSGDNASRYSQGYMAYFHNIDGQYLDATDFIQIKDGVCVPKLYSGLTWKQRMET